MPQNDSLLSALSPVFRCAIGVILVIAAAGCGTKNIYPVSGQIVDKNGNPVIGLKDGSVEFESLDHKASANGRIDEKGNFRLSTEAPGDGAVFGKHRVQIMRPRGSPETPTPPVVDLKYEDQKTTDLFVTIEKRSNVIKLEVDLFKK